MAVLLRTRTGQAPSFNLLALFERFRLLNEALESYNTESDCKNDHPLLRPVQSSPEKDYNFSSQIEMLLGKLRGFCFHNTHGNFKKILLRTTGPAFCDKIVIKITLNIQIV